MESKVCLITGSTSGLGKETAKKLAERGATVIIHGRNKTKGEEVISEINEETENSSMDLMLADFSSLDEVRKLAANFKKRYNQLDVLVNNAGMLARGRQFSKEGIEMSFAVNHLAHFLLTHLLLDFLKKSAPSRIVNVASETHSDKIDFDHLTTDEGPSGYEAYKQSKLANILFTYKLARKISSTGVTVNCLHPGAVRTDLAREYSILGKLWRYFPLFRSSKKAAETIIYLASSPEVKEVNGKYFKDKEEIKSSPSSYDKELQEKLWKVSEKLSGLKD